MNDSHLLALISKINDAELSSLSAISRISRDAFFRRMHGILDYAECQYIYTHAIHSLEHAKRRGDFIRRNIQLHNIKFMSSR